MLAATFPGMGRCYVEGGDMATSYEYPIRNATHLSDIEVLAEAHELVEAFLEFTRTEHINNDILDIRVLPASRASLENAFRLVIATDPRRQVRRRLISSGLMLARFQADIGIRMSITPAPNSAHFGRASKADGDWADRNYERFDAALANMARDTARLQKIFADAEAIAERRFEPLAMKPPFREDGTYTWYGHH